MSAVEQIKNADIYTTILAFLYILAAVGIYAFGISALVTLVVSTIAAVVAESAAYAVRKRPITLRNLRKALITAALAGFLVPPGSALYVPAFVAAAAILSKHVLHLPKKKHIFNPAAFGALVGSLVFAFPAVWWGTISPGLVLALGVLLIYKFKRLELPVALLITYSVFSTIGFYTGLSTARVDSVLLSNIPLIMMAFFMAPEPVTSPFTRNGRIAFGVLSGISVFVLGFVGGFDALLGGLLLANIFTQPINRMMLRRAKPTAQPQSQISLG